MRYTYGINKRSENPYEEEREVRRVIWKYYKKEDNRKENRYFISKFKYDILSILYGDVFCNPRNLVNLDGIIIT